MNRTRTNDRFTRTRNGSAESGRGGSRVGSSARSRSAGSSRSGGYGRRRAALQGEFELPRTITPALPAVEGFADLDMPAALLGALSSQGVTVPFPIQAATLPNSLAGRDVLGRGRTGSGKTLAFGLALLARTAGQRAEARQPLGLILVPTRELAQQVTDALAPYARSVRLRLATVVGGMPIGRQASALRAGAEIVVATPGRLKDLIDRGDCRLNQVSITVLDEADQMADMGFMPQVTALLDQVRPEGQRMLFSATLDRNVDLLVRRYLSDPVVHSVDPSAGAVTTMEHHVLHIHGADKHTATTQIAARDGRVIMFLDTKHAVDGLTEHLLNSGVRAAALHGGKARRRRAGGYRCPVGRAAHRVRPPGHGPFVRGRPGTAPALRRAVPQRDQLVPEAVPDGRTAPPDPHLTQHEVELSAPRHAGSRHRTAIPTLISGVKPRALNAAPGWWAHIARICVRRRGRAGAWTYDQLL
ncbi:hypothetical protein Shyhy02_77880 [Streptomyces hygroscopicus subsp. hygroscopicus]|nr:DEAD/DEAH box helicase [Streptomyces hygroscopicus]GLV79788.1 hypothetical protein Shyhy02_77880 [Streptomyces hygroscopicus subsp. hygroscopicus]